MSQLDNDRFVGFNADNAPQPQEDADGGMRGGTPRDELHELLVTTSSLSEAEIQEAIRLAGQVSSTISRRMSSDAGEDIEKVIRDRVSEDLADETTAGVGSSAAAAAGAAGTVAGTAGAAFGNSAMNVIGSALSASSVKGLQWAMRMLQGSALAANAAGAIQNFPNTPIGRIFNQGGRLGKWNQFWILVGERIEREIRFALPRSGATWNQGLGPSSVSYQTLPGQTRQSFSDAGGEIEALINSYLNNTSQGSHVAKPHGPTTSPAFGNDRTTLGEAGTSIENRTEHNLRSMYGNGEGMDDPSEGNQAQTDLESIRERYRERSEFYDVDTAGRNLSRNINERTVKLEDTNQLGITTAADTGTQDQTSQNISTTYRRNIEIYDDSHEPVREGDENISRWSGESKSLPGNAVDFMEWASYRLRWGEAYTHLFNVYIYDSIGYGPRDGSGTSELDFKGDGDGYEKAFSFGVTGVTVGGMSITNNRPGVLKTPLPQSADIPETISLHLKDYARMPLYQYMYSWYLHWYNPHKRRWVPGREGKYKNIKIEVQHLYGDYTDEGGSVRDAAGFDPASADGNATNFGYKTFLTITALNCIPQGIPDLAFEYGSGISPFEFDMTLEPSDVYYDFDNPGFLASTNMQPHLANVYEHAHEQSHAYVATDGREASVDWD